MAKYIGTYTNSGAVQTALENLELSRPFVAYTTDNDQVIYGPQIDRAEVGDIVVYSTGDTLLHYIKQADYNTTDYPTAAYVPVGVVCYPQEDNIFSGAAGEITFVGLNWTDPTNPNVGKTTPPASNCAWGYGNFDIPELTNYPNAAAAITDMNGKANTEAVLVYATGQPNWKTDSAITWANEAGYYPIFECSWRYHTSGTAQGDWFVPACGQVYFIYNNEIAHQQLNAGLSLVGAYPYDFTGSTGGNIGTSTEKDAGYAYNWWGKSNFRDTGKSWGGDFMTRPFCSKLMTRI